VTLRSLTFSAALVALGLPATAEGQIVRHELALSAATVTFPAITEAHYDAGLVAATSSITFTMDARNGPLGVVRTSTVSIRASGPTMGGSKAVSDLQWRRTDLGTWTGLTTTDAVVESRPIARNGVNDAWSNTVLFRSLLNWGTDVPATYTATIIFTLTITTP
jgi:hypothetical protein